MTSILRDRKFVVVAAIALVVGSIAAVLDSIYFPDMKYGYASLTVLGLATLFVAVAIWRDW